MMWIPVESHEIIEGDGFCVSFRPGSAPPSVVAALKAYGITQDAA